MEINQTILEIVKKITENKADIQYLLALRKDIIPTSGWVASSEWTRKSDYEFECDNDQTLYFTKGTKVRYELISGTYEYGIVTNSSYAIKTTVTLATNADYAMTSSPIITNISHIENPEGWPDWFNFTLVVGGSGAMTYTLVSTQECKFRVSAQTVFFMVRASGTTGGVANVSIYAQLPIECQDASSLTSGFGQVNDGGLIGATVRINAGVPDVMEFRRYDGANFGIGAGRVMAGMAIYHMA